MAIAVAPEDRTELRLALVCYGGVSLAVYMHGITKELHKLVRASRCFDRAESLDAPNPFPADQTEAAYYDALRELAKEGRPLTVTIDVIAGTSAGGINGVVLAKVLAVDGNQDALKKLWLEEADLRKLLHGLPVGPLPVRAVVGFLEALLRRPDPLQPSSPLKGDVMSKLLYQALKGMNEGGMATLLPSGGTLDLYVTLSDLHGFEVLVPTGAGGASQRDRQNAQVLRFSVTTDDRSALGPDAAANLAFAARATSCFPGAFPPVSLSSFATECHIPERDLTLASHFVSQYEENGRTAAQAWFVDGGLLDNAPFDHVITAIARKRAERQVLRRMVYIEPDPGGTLGQHHGSGATALETPGYVSALWKSVGDVKASHSVLRDLLDLRDLNTRIAQVGAIAEAQNDAVLAAVGEAMTKARAPETWSVADKKAVLTVSNEMHARAKDRLGAAFSTYDRLKMEAAVARLADEIATRFQFPPDAGRSSFIRAALGAWTRSTPEWRSESRDESAANWLRPVDLPYRERRLHFLLSGVNELYSEAGGGAGRPTRKDLNELKAKAWNLLDELRRAPAAAVQRIADGKLSLLNRPDVDRCLLQDPVQFAEDNERPLRELFEEYSTNIRAVLDDGSTPLWDAFATHTTGWDEKYRRGLVARYFGFPMWDGLIFPTIALSELPQFTPIGVTQISPLVAKALKPLGENKLEGIPLHHFAGFTKIESRANDYLWGRLDAVELILRTLYGAASPMPAHAATTPPVDEKEAVASAGGEVLQRGLRAVLDSESGLGRIRKMMDDLREQVQHLPLPATIQVSNQPVTASS